MKPNHPIEWTDDKEELDRLIGECMGELVEVKRSGNTILYPFSGAEYEACLPVFNRSIEEFYKLIDPENKWGGKIIDDYIIEFTDVSSWAYEYVVRLGCNDVQCKYQILDYKSVDFAHESISFKICIFSDNDYFKNTPEEFKKRKQIN